MGESQTNAVSECFWTFVVGVADAYFVPRSVQGCEALLDTFSTLNGPGTRSSRKAAREWFLEQDGLGLEHAHYR